MSAFLDSVKDEITQRELYEIAYKQGYNRARQDFIEFAKTSVCEVPEVNSAKDLTKIDDDYTTALEEYYLATECAKHDKCTPACKYFYDCDGFEAPNERK